MLGKISFGRRKRRGGSVLETFMIMPVLLSLTFGTCEYGYFFFMKHSVQGAAREGARAAIVQGADNTSVTKAIAMSLNAAGLNSSSVTLDSKYTMTISPAVNSTSGTAMTIGVSANWGTVGVHLLPVSIFGLPMGGIPGTKNVTGTTVMRKEG